jgi:hypothetical protein
MKMPKVVITVSEEVLRDAKRAVRAERAKTLSAYVSMAIAEKLERDTLIETLDAMDAGLGPPQSGSAVLGKASTVYVTSQGVPHSGKQANRRIGEDYALPRLWRDACVGWGKVDGASRRASVDICSRSL